MENFQLMPNNVIIFVAVQGYTRLFCVFRYDCVIAFITKEFPKKFFELIECVFKAILLTLKLCNFSIKIESILYFSRNISHHKLLLKIPKMHHLKH